MDQTQPLQPILRLLIDGRTLSQVQSHEAFHIIMDGKATDAQIGSLLTALQTRPGGPTIDEIVGAAAAMRDHSVKVPVPQGVEVIDTCGTGGDHSSTFNISTTAALIAAGAGAYVAKHGNRSVTSNSGSSQVLEALGVKLGVDSSTLTRCLAEAHVCFCFAPAHHPAMKFAAGPRRDLGFRTIFNMLGPLTNPAGAKRQVIGVFANQLTETFAQVLKQLGAAHAMVVHGMGMDEITTTGVTRITVLKNGKISTSEFNPADVGLKIASAVELKCAGVDESAAIVRRVLSGEHGPARDIAALNAAAAFVVADLAADLAHGLNLAHKSIDTGAAKSALDKLVAITNS